jgi:hypothetical protein
MKPNPLVAYRTKCRKALTELSLTTKLSLDNALA